MQDLGSSFGPVFTVKGCGMAEFNGKYFLDTAHNDGFSNGEFCYRKNGVGDAGDECTVENDGSGVWYMTKNYKGTAANSLYYFAGSNSKQPPTNGWKVLDGLGPPPQFVYEAVTSMISDVPNF